MLEIVPSSRFRKDVKAAIRRGYDMQLLKDVVDLLAAETTLPEKYRDHALTGDYAGYRECHVKPDWLLVYQTDRETLTLLVFRTGTHADLF